MTASPHDLDILHLSDTHLMAGAGKHYGRIDNRAGLARVLARASPLDRVDLVVCSGDLSDDGTAESYRALAEAIEPWAAQRGGRVVYAMGNHDQRAGFREVLGDGQHGPAGGSPDDLSGEPIHSVEWSGGFRIVTIDSSVPRAGYGRIDEAQLSWLREELSEPAPEGTVLVLHHPPVAAETPLLAALQLQDPDALAAVIEATDVRVVLAGHYHIAMVDRVAGIPVVISGGVANQGDLFATEGTEGAVVGSAGTIVRLRANGGLRVFPFTAASAEDGTPVFHFDAAMVATIAEQAGPPAV
jgi:Icc protein